METNNLLKVEGQKLISDKRLSREVLTNPFSNKTYQERLDSSNVIHYNEKYTIENLGNGYVKIIKV